MFVRAAHHPHWRDVCGHRGAERARAVEALPPPPEGAMRFRLTNISAKAISIASRCLSSAPGKPRNASRIAKAHQAWGKQVASGRSDVIGIPVIQSIAHPTDFSATSALAFAHALRLALETKSRLSLLHVNEKGSQDHWTSFPHVRETLVRWGLLNEKAARTDLEARLGIEVTKVEIRHRDPVTGLFEFFLSHRPDLIVLSTHGREGLNRWLRGLYPRRSPATRMFRHFSLV